MDSQLMKMLKIIEKNKMEIMNNREWSQLSVYEKEKIKLLSDIITDTFAPEKTN